MVAQGIAHCLMNDHSKSGQQFVVTEKSTSVRVQSDSICHVLRRAPKQAACSVVVLSDDLIVLE